MQIPNFGQGKSGPDWIPGSAYPLPVISLRKAEALLVMSLAVSVGRANLEITAFPLSEIALFSALLHGVLSVIPDSVTVPR